MERKVILNKCFGRYSWSKQGVIEILKEKGIQGLRFWAENGLGYKEVFTEKEFLSDKGRDWFVTTNNEEWYLKCESCVFNCHGFGREDPDAIKVLEERGSEFCSGKHASLAIESFDDEFFGYRIDEYDGFEDLDIFPQLTREQVLNCNSVSDVADILEKIGVIEKTA